MDAYRIEDCIAQASIGVTRGQVLRIEHGAGVELAVVYGSVWVTQLGDTSDVLLGAGESFRITRPGSTVVSGLRPSLVTLTPPAPRARALSIAMARPGTKEMVALFDADERTQPGRFDAWLDRYWARLFVPTSQPTTAAL